MHCRTFWKRVAVQAATLNGPKQRRDGLRTLVTGLADCLGPGDDFTVQSCKQPKTTLAATVTSCDTWGPSDRPDVVVYDEYPSMGCLVNELQVHFSYRDSLTKFSMEEDVS